MVLISRLYPFQDGHSCQNKVRYVQYCTVLYNAVQWISIYGYPYVGSMDPLRWPVGSWGARPPPRPVQTLAVACGEEKFAIAVWPRGLAMRFAKFITPMAGASACGGLCDYIYIHHVHSHLHSHLHSQLQRGAKG